MSTHAARLIPAHGAAAAHGHPTAVHDGRPVPLPPLPAVPKGQPASSPIVTAPVNGRPVPSGNGVPSPAAGGPPADGSPAVDKQHFRNVLGRFATGVVAITAIDPAGLPCGLAANSFTSVSLDPPLVAFCVAHTSTSWPRLKAAGRFCVNVLAEDHEQVCRRLAAKGGDKFAGLGWRPSPNGTPVIDGALAWIDCSVEAEHLAGDHIIVVARVHALDTHTEGGPLVFFRGAYGRFQG